MSRFDLSDPDAVAFCPSCGAGYTAGTARCLPCGADLVSRADAEARERATAGDEEAISAVSLCRTPDRAEAALLESDLTRAGIRFFTRELGIQPLSFEGLPGLIEFVVAADDLEPAREILRRVEGQAEPGDPTASS